jgi:hypothetical protein
VTLTPLERADGVEGPVLTWEEVARLEGTADDEFAALIAPSDPDRPVLERADEPGGYNGIYFSRGDLVAVVNGEPRSSLIRFPANGRLPEFSREGQGRNAERLEFRARFGEYDHPELRPPRERCLIPFGSNLGPPMLPNNVYNDNYTIVQNADHIMIMAEMIHDVRIIRLREPDPLPEDIQPWFGDSWGHWDGNTLVVETSNQPPRQLFNEPFHDIEHSSELRVTERFTPVDQATILYEFEVRDPKTYSEPWGGEVPMKRFGDQIYEYGCHEGNYSLPNVLSGGRYQDRLQAANRSSN